MKALVWSVLLVGITVSGCLGETPTTKGEDGTPEQALPTVTLRLQDPALDFDAGIEAPTWSVGDWWHYQGAYSSGEVFDTRIVVYAEDGSNYLVTAEDPQLILRAAITHYPTIGAVVKSNHNQFIHGQEVSYLRFPMTNGSWDAPFRDFTAQYTTSYADLNTPKGVVPGFVTTVRNQADGLVRMHHGWSPVTKWFTNFTFDFDGVAPADVTYTLLDWGTNHTGTLPVIDIIDGVHRIFTSIGAAPPDPSDPTGAVPGQPPPAQDSMEIGAEGSDLLIAMFAGAGGAGQFDFRAVSAADPSKAYALSWQSTTGGAYFAWAVHPAVPTGDYHIVGEGAAAFFAFLFGETYEIRRGEATLPAEA